MGLGTWWRGDLLPDLSPLSLFSAHPSTDAQLIARITALPLLEVYTRFQASNRLYLAFLAEIPVAYGWVAAREGGISELQFSFTLPPRNLYLWDFQTLPTWRGRGIYPHLLQAIIHTETPGADRFWIGATPGNGSASRSISRAGFQFIADFVVSDDRISGLQFFNSDERVQALASLFNLPLIASE